MVTKKSYSNKSFFFKCQIAFISSFLKSENQKISYQVQGEVNGTVVKLVGGMEYKTIYLQVVASKWRHDSSST